MQHKARRITIPTTAPTIAEVEISVVSSKARLLMAEVEISVVSSKARLLSVVEFKGIPLTKLISSNSNINLVLLSFGKQ
jgi:hypothetical protein